MTTPRLTKEYISNKEIPQLFECLMTGLMYHRPSDHITYLQDCLEKIKRQGITEVRWDLLLEARRNQTPLPPITPTNGLSRDYAPFDSQLPQKKPLPDIKSGEIRLKLQRRPTFIITFFPPGSDKMAILQEITQIHPELALISMGEVLRKMLENNEETGDESWEETDELISSGQLAPGSITLAALISAINEKPDAGGYIIDGFPRTANQLEDWMNHLVETPRFILLVDYEEATVTRNLRKRGPARGRSDNNEEAIELRIATFKRETLPVIKHFDDGGLLRLVDGEQDVENIKRECLEIFTKAKEEGSLTPHPPSGTRPDQTFPGGRVSPPVKNIPLLELSVPDTGRKSDLPGCPIIFLLGGPGAGATTQAKKLVDRMDGAVHINVGDQEPADIGAIKNKITQEGSGATCIIIDGFPRNASEVAAFNTNIGGVSRVILLDTFEPWMVSKLTEKGVTQNVISQRVDRFKTQTLSVPRHYDENGLLDVVLAEASVDNVAQEVLAYANAVVSGSVPVITHIASIILDEKDTGRKDGMPTCPIILLMGGPGVGCKTQAEKLVSSCAGITHVNAGGERANIQVIKKSVVDAGGSARGIVITGFAKDGKQLSEFNNHIGGVSSVILLDSFEPCLIKRMKGRGDNDQKIKDSIEFYKTQTLSVVRHFDETGKLEVLIAEGVTDKVQVELINIVNKIMNGSGIWTDMKTDVGGAVTNIPQIYPIRDDGRKPGLPKSPIVLLLGGPGVGCSTIAQKLAAELPKCVHINAGDKENVDIQTLKKEVTQAGQASVIVVDGFPKSEKQFSEFNEQIGGVTRGILLDSFEPVLASRLKERGRPSDTPDNTTKRIDQYKKDTLPIINYLDDYAKLTVVMAERSVDDVYKQVKGCVASVMELSHDPSEEVELKEEFLESKEEIKEDLVAEEEPEKVVEEIVKEVDIEETVETVEVQEMSSEPQNELKDAKVIFVLGGPGSGKGTQCAKIVEKYGFNHLSSGDLLRAEVESGSEKGIELKEIMERGDLVSLDAVLQLLKDAMCKKICGNKGFLIDGYPRELEQGTRFENEIVPCECVFFFDVTEELMKERLLKRAETSGRVDDNEETIMKRFRTFRDHTQPVIDHYEAQGKVVKIDASGQIDDIFGQVSQVIDTLTM